MLYKLSLSDIRLHIVGRTNENPPWRHGGRSMGYNHLIVIISGDCKCTVEDRRYELKKYDTLFIPANKYYTLLTDTHCEYFFACFYADYALADKETQAKCTNDLKKPEKKFYLPQIDNDRDDIYITDTMNLDHLVYAETASLFTKLQNLNITEKYLDRLLIDIHFKEMLILFASSSMGADKKDEKSRRSLRQITKYIDENYTEQITLDDLSEKFLISKEYICSIFRENLNTSVSGYVNSVKMCHAVELLSNSSMNVSQISEYLGYSSVYYFSRVFKKIYGVSPTNFG